MRYLNKNDLSDISSYDTISHKYTGSETVAKKVM